MTAMKHRFAQIGLLKLNNDNLRRLKSQIIDIIEDLNKCLCWDRLADRYFTSAEESLIDADLI